MKTIKTTLITMAACMQITGTSFAFEFANPFKPEDEMAKLRKSNPKAYWEKFNNFNWEKISDRLSIDKNSVQKNSIGIASLRARFISREDARNYPMTYEYTIVEYVFDCEKNEMRISDSYVFLSDGTLPRHSVNEAGKGSAWTSMKKLASFKKVVEAFEWSCGNPATR